MTSGRRTGAQLLAALSQAVNSHGDYDFAHREFSWWVRWASEQEREELASTSPYARCVVAEYVREQS